MGRQLPDGSVGGPALLTRLFDGAPQTELESSRNGARIRYGAGIFILADNTLADDGSFEGFQSQFSVSPAANPQWPYSATALRTSRNS